MRSQYIIIAITLITLVATMLFLTYIEQEQRIAGKDFWSVYFADPFSDTNDFVIDNQMKDSLFIFKAYRDEEEIFADDMYIKKDEKKIITIEGHEKTTPIKIEITDGFNEKTLEKK